MARPTFTPERRASKVTDAAAKLAPALTAALAAMADPAATADERLAAWESVEIHGATIHRQARILAGKSRGG
jgi:hypothetical protein